MIVSNIVSSIDPATVFVVLGACLFTGIITNYVADLITWHRVQKRGLRGGIPPVYPTLIPYLGVIVPFLWNTPAFLQKVT